jgi:hypothetical protein
MLLEVGKIHVFKSEKLMFLIDVLCGFPKTVWPHKAGCSFKVVSSEIVYRDLVKNRDLTLRF